MRHSKAAKRRRWVAPVAVLGALVLVAGVATTVVTVHQKAVDAASADPVTAEQIERANADGRDDWAATVPGADGMTVEGDAVVNSPETVPVQPAGVRPGEAWDKRDAIVALPTVLIEPGAEVVDIRPQTKLIFQTAFSGAEDGPGDVGVYLDDCLQDWASAELPQRPGTSGLAVEDVCGKPAAVLFGGYSVSNFDLINRVLNGVDKKELSKLLIGPDTLAYAAVGTADGRGIMIVAAPTSEEPTGVPNDTNGNPVALNVPPAGWKG